MHFINWYPKGEVSNLEATLRIPKFRKEFFFVLLKRPLVSWVVSFVLLDFIFNSEFLIWWLSFLAAFIIEMYRTHFWLLHKLITVHKQKLNNTVEVFEQSKTDPNESYTLDYINLISENSAWSIAHFAYVDFIANIWEYLFPIISKIFLKKVPADFTPLYKGYETRTYSAFHSIYNASVKNPSTQNNALESTLSEITTKFDSWDLKYPTIRESIDEISELLDKPEVTSPQKLLSEEKFKRDSLLQDIESNIRFLPKQYLFLLKLAQENIKYLPDYEYFAFEHDYYLRQLLFLFMKRVKKPTEDIFEYTWEALSTIH